MKIRTLFASVAAMFALTSLTGCFPIVAASSAVVGTTIAEERSAGDKLDDNIISLKVKDKFAQTEFGELYSKVTISVHEGRVMLTGSVTEAQYKTQAGNLAWKTNGVKEVINELEVKKSDIRDFAKDSFLANTIRSKLLFEQDVRSVNYTLDVNHSIVYILGVAQDRQELDKALQIARSVKGVHKVVNHVLLKSDDRRKTTEQ